MWKWIVTLVHSRVARPLRSRPTGSRRSETESEPARTPVAGAPACPGRSRRGGPRKARSSSRWRRRAGRDRSWLPDAPARCVEPQVWTCEVRLDRAHPARNGGCVGSVRDQLAAQPLLGSSAPGRTMQCSLAVDASSRSAASRAPRKPVAPVSRILLPPGGRLPFARFRAHIVGQHGVSEHLLEWISAERLRRRARSRAVYPRGELPNRDGLVREFRRDATPRASSTAAVSSMTPNESAPRSDRGAATSSGRRRRRSVAMPPTGGRTRSLILERSWMPDRRTSCRPLQRPGRAGNIPSGDRGQRSGSHAFPAGIPLDLAAGRLGQCAGREKHDR